MQESTTRHSSKKTERPQGVASDQSVDRVKEESGSQPSTIKSEPPSDVASVPFVDRVKLQEFVSLPSITKKERPSCVASDTSIDGGKLQDSCLHHSEKTEMPPGVASDQSIDGIEQQFNTSSNQINMDASVMKTQITELDAVSGFTHFVDGSRPHKGKNDRPPLLKREVSRTWSFTAEVEPVNAKCGSSFEKSRVLDKSDDVNLVGLQSPLSDAPKLSSCPTNVSDNKETRQSTASHFASNGDVSQKTAGESTEDFDDNSVDAVPAAALKKAIEQAQESIRLAKIIMERKKDGYQDGSKFRHAGCSKITDRETKIDHKTFGSKNKSTWSRHEELDPIFPAHAGVDGKLTPPFHAESSESERVLGNVETYKESGETYAGRCKSFTLSHIQTETTHFDEHVKVEKHEKIVETDEMQREGQNFPGCGVVDMDHAKASNFNSLVPSTGESSSNLGRLETGTEALKWRNIFANLIKRSEVVPQLEEGSLGTSHGIRGMEKSSEEELYRANFVRAEGSENNVESLLSSSQRIPEHDKVVDEAMDEANENLRICREDDVNDLVENDRDDKNIEECLEIASARSQSNHMLNESFDLVRNESLDQQEMERESESVIEGEGNGSTHSKTYDDEIRGTMQKEGHFWFDSEEEQKEVLLEVINEEKPDVFTEVGELKVEVDEALQPKINDNKHDFGDNEDGPELLSELVRNQAEEEHVNISKNKRTNMMEASNCTNFQWREALSETEETDATKRGTGTGESEEAAHEEDIDEAVDLSSGDASTIFDMAHINGTGDLVAETQDSCHVESNSKEGEHENSVKNAEDVPKPNGAVSEPNEDRMEEGFSKQLDDGISRTKNFRRSASEEIFVENKLHDAYEGLPSDSRKEPVNGMDADPEEHLSQDELSKASTNIHAAAQEYSAAHEHVDEIHRQDVPQVLESHFRKVELGFPDIEQMLEQTADSDEGSISDSSFEKIDELSAKKSEECSENVEGMTSNKENLSNETISDETKSHEELREGLYSQLHVEHNKMDKPFGSEGSVGTGVNVENDKEYIAGASLEERDAKEGNQNFESNDQQQRIEAIKKGREREKDRIAVERAIREARERAFAEVRERAERAAVERAASEVRQRMAEAREKVEKPAVVKQDKASIEAKLRAERAAVERATAEARERALEKAKSLKTSGELKAPAEKQSTEGFSSSSRNNVLKHSFSSSVSITCLLFACLKVLFACVQEIYIRFSCRIWRLERTVNQHKGVKQD